MPGVVKDAPVIPGTPLGCLKLDNYTFKKVLNLPVMPEGMQVLVKFDHEGAAGEKQEEFKTLCKASQRAMHFFVAEVNVPEDPDDEGVLTVGNKQKKGHLHEVFDLTRDDFPAYVYFSQKEAWGEKYNGTISAFEIAKFLRDHNVKIRVPDPAIPRRKPMAQFEDFVHEFFHGDRKKAITRAKRYAGRVAKQEPYGSDWAEVMEEAEIQMKKLGVHWNRWLHGEIVTLENRAPDLPEPSKSKMKHRIRVLHHFDHLKHRLKDEL